MNLRKSLSMKGLGASPSSSSEEDPDDEVRKPVMYHGRLVAEHRQG